MNSSLKLLLLLFSVGLSMSMGSRPVSALAAGSMQGREVRVVNANGQAGQKVVVSIELVAAGNENALGFSLNFNQSFLSNPVVALGSGAVGATFNVNANSAASGRLGLILGMPSGQVLPAGVRQIFTVTFDVAANVQAQSTSITFGDQPVTREIADVSANTLPATYTNGAVFFTTPNPVPTVTSILPSSTLVNSGAFTLTVTGTNFINNSTVNWNGNGRVTTFVSATQLTAVISATDLTQAGTFPITVTNPAPGGGTSNSVNFTVTNPAPQLTSLSPGAAIVNSNAITLTLTGSGFVPQSRVLWNAAQRPTTFVSSTQLTAQISASDLATQGQVSVVVSNPAPGGGNSGTLSFTILAAPAPTIVVMPSAPNVNSDISVEIKGTWFDSCVPGNPQVSRVGNAIKVNTSNPGAVCLTVLTPYTVTAPLGKLPAGSYTLEVVHTNPAITVSLGQTSFVVTGALTSANAASYSTASLATESIVAAFGLDLATASEGGLTVPLPTSLAGTSIKVKDGAGTERLAPLFYVSSLQVNYQLPPGTVTGTATMTLTSGDGKVSTGTSTIELVAPGLFTLDGSGKGLPAAYILRIKANNQAIEEPLWQPGPNGPVPVPIDLGVESDQVFLVLFGTGMRFRNNLPAVNVAIGGTASEVIYAGEAPGYVGLDQCNVRIPRSLIGRGAVDVVMTVENKPANTVTVTVK